MKLLELYLSGQRDEACALLSRLNAQDIESHEMDDAIAMIEELYSRVIHNLESVVSLLRLAGYQFGCEVMHKLIPSAKPDKLDRLLDGPFLLADDQLTSFLPWYCEETEKLPMALRLWYRKVAVVNLIGIHEEICPRNGRIHSDPLVVISLKDAIKEVDGMSTDKQMMPISPSSAAKAWLSDSSPGYLIDLRSPMIDPEMITDTGTTSFIRYLRRSVNLGCFPGLRNDQSKLITAIRGNIRPV